MSRTLLSPNVGVPLAVLAALLWFLVETFNITGRRRRGFVRSSAVLVTVVLVVLVLVRFKKYS